MKPESMNITKEILQFIERYAEQTSADYGENLAMESDYNELALRLFNYQFQYNFPYRKYCLARRKSPHTVKEWQHIPPLPMQAFKTLTLSCEPVMLLKLPSRQVGQRMSISEDDIFIRRCKYGMPLWLHHSSNLYYLNGIG